MRHTVSTRFIKRDWGSGRPSWRKATPTTHHRDIIATAIRRLSNRRTKVAWFNGSSIKCY